MARERESPQPQPVSYTVEQLVAVNPYNPDILSDLENYVNEQVKPYPNPKMNFRDLLIASSYAFLHHRGCMIYCIRL